MQDLHLKRKVMARQERDKEMSRLDAQYLAFNFDLEAVLSTPKSNAGIIFYKRKLAVYNLTVYNLADSAVSCYIWDESHGRRGANEISTCIFKFINSHSSVKECSMMSDSCGGQNRNTTFAMMCILLLQSHPTLETLNHKFFETGHSHMECDSVHAKIEKSARNVSVYTTNEWETIIKTARKKPMPFQTEILFYDDFYDFKASVLPQLSKVPWMKVCWLQYNKQTPFIVKYKTCFSDIEFQTREIIPLRKSDRLPASETTINKAYKQRINISKDKFKDLKSLCSDLVIPRNHHNFYNDLPHDVNVIDRLPEPNFDSNDED